MTSLRSLATESLPETQSVGQEVAKIGETPRTLSTRDPPLPSLRVIDTPRLELGTGRDGM